MKERFHSIICVGPGGEGKSNHHRSYPSTNLCHNIDCNQSHWTRTGASEISDSNKANGDSIRENTCGEAYSKDIVDLFLGIDGNISCCFKNNRCECS
eukprot:XP_001708603.1 Hypothetical protein GL50803_91749 [Giardia lamblia ATCC 50803]